MTTSPDATWPVGDLVVAIRSPDARLRRLQLCHFPQGARRLTLRARLHGIAQQDQRDDQNDGLVVDVRLCAALFEEPRREGGDCRVDEGGTGPHRNQRVHVGGAVAQAGPGARVEPAASPEHDEQAHGEQGISEHVRVDRIEPRERGTQRRINHSHRPGDQRICAVRRVPAGAAHERHGEQHGHKSQRKADE